VINESTINSHATRPIQLGDAYVVMGVSGSGKTTLSALLAGAINAEFHDADDYHDAPSVEKMREGVPLSDDDRKPWLMRLNELLQSRTRAGNAVVLACSALKRIYREQILRDVPNVRLIYLAGDYDTIAARIRARSAHTSHYMPEALLQSQFDALEPPSDAIMIDIALPTQAQLACVLASLSTAANEAGTHPQ
jgi:gluconokinase